MANFLYTHPTIEFLRWDFATKHEEERIAEEMEWLDHEIAPDNEFLPKLVDYSGPPKITEAVNERRQDSERLVTLPKNRDFFKSVWLAPSKVEVYIKNGQDHTCSIVIDDMSEEEDLFGSNGPNKSQSTLFEK